MTNFYKMNSDDLSNAADELAKIAEDYKTYKNRLKSLSKAIDKSDKWVDKINKTEFINCINGYTSLYENIYKGLCGYCRYVKRKSKEAAEIETKFSIKGIKPRGNTTQQYTK